MIRKIYCSFLLFITGLTFSQNLNSEYFDKDWKKTTKDKASFYRITPSKKIGDLILIEDFYINKTPQFQGYTLQNNENSYVGDVVWHDVNGFDLSVYQFYNYSAVPVLTYYYPSGKKCKTIQYKDGKKDGFTILYHQDGTVLMKGKYNKGKPSEGDFEEVINYDNYRQNESDTNTEAEVTDEPVTEASPQILIDDSPVEGASQPKRQTAKKIIKKKIFWINSKQLAQETWYNVEEYSSYAIKQVNYDLAGKILQTITESDFEKYGHEISNGTVYDYYFQNKFVIAIKSKTDYKKRQKNGNEITYHPNGKISELTQYIDSEIVGDQITYDENETIIKKHAYKNGKPYDGNFNEKLSGDLIVNQNYVKGIKEGEAVVRTDKDSIAAKGIYKSGKPYNGTFIEKKEDDISELIHVVNFKKTGIQTVYDYRLENVIKTYTCINDILNGETIFYDDKKVTGKLEYKNNLPYEGKLVDAESATLYKKGEIIEKIFYRSKYEDINEDNILKSEYFSNGKLTKIINHSFAIKGKLQDSYEGIYKNEKPYSGYFATDFHEFNYVDYYENGSKKYQYSNNYLANLDNYTHPTYDIKSTYDGEKIVDGVEYIKLNRQFISKYWKKGVLQSFDFDLFAVHYFNRFHFELKNNTIEITESNTQKKGTIISEKADIKNTYKLIIEDTVVMSISSLELNSDTPQETGTIVYYESGNTIEAKMLDWKEVDQDKRQESEMLSALFSSSIKGYKTIEENFNSIVDDFSKGKDIEAMFGKSDTTNLLTGIRFNKNKKPEIGILILKNKNNLYDLKSFVNGKILEEKKNIDSINIRKEAKILDVLIQKKLNESYK